MTPASKLLTSEQILNMLPLLYNAFTRNQLLPFQYKSLLFVTLFRTALYILGYDGGPGIGFLYNSSLELPRLYLYNIWFQ